MSIITGIDLTLQAPVYDKARRPVSRDWGVANMWVREMHWRKAGDMVRGHCHTFPHPHRLSHGAVRLFILENGVWLHRGDYRVVDLVPKVLFIQAGSMHMMVALEDNTVGSCLHAQRVGPEIWDVLPVEMTIDGDIPDDVRKTLYPLVNIEQQRAAMASIFEESDIPEPAKV